MAEQKPTVGRIVHYVSHGTPVREDGTQAFTKQCRAAIITEVLPFSDLYEDVPVSLAVFNPTGMFFNRNVSCDETGREGGTWHWPEREDSHG